MAKKTKRAEAPAPPPESLPLFGRKLVWAGGSVVLLGFFVLFFADPLGRNWASRLCPFLILGGYAVLGLGLSRPPAPPPPASGA